MPESAMLKRLQRDTAAFHCHADMHRLAILNLPRTETSYREYLARIFGFEAPVEAALQASDVGNLLDLRSRNQTRLLRSDLRALGEREPSIPRCGSVLPFHHAPEALAWAYVLERNTLLHGLIERQLQTRMRDTMKRAGAYLAAPERSATQRWTELGSAMDRTAMTSNHADRMVAAVSAAFRAQRVWFEHAVPSRRVA